jgi:hypothetical protein
MPKNVPKLQVSADQKYTILKNNKYVKILDTGVCENVTLQEVYCAYR